MTFDIPLIFALIISVMIVTPNFSYSAIQNSSQNLAEQSVGNVTIRTQNLSLSASSDNISLREKINLSTFEDFRKVPLEPEEIPTGIKNLTQFLEEKNKANQTFPKTKVFTINQSTALNSSLVNQSFLNVPVMPSSAGNQTSANVLSESSAVHAGGGGNTGRFEGISSALGCSVSNLCDPPDPQIAVGNNRVVEMVNNAFAIWSLDPFFQITTGSLNDFFGVTNTDFVFDPRIIFDETSQRWFAAATDATTETVMLAVSNTGNIDDSWGIYDLSFDNCPDYPSIGYSNDLFIVTATNFAICTRGNTAGFVGEQHWILQKSDLVNGLSSIEGFKSPEDSASPGNLHVVRNLASSGWVYTVITRTNATGSSFLDLTGYRQTTSGIQTYARNYPIQDLTVPPNALQPSGTTPSPLIGTGDNRVIDAVMHAGRIWAGLNDNCVPSGDTSSRSCLRLIQVDPFTGARGQDFDVGLNGVYLFFPALAITASGHLTILYAFSSTSDFPSLAITGRDSADPDGTVTPSEVLVYGGKASNSAAYGDYFSAVTVPSVRPDVERVFIVGEYVSGDSTTPIWSTGIAEILIP